MAPTPFGGTPGWIASAGSNGELTIRAIGEIRKGTSWYRIYLIFALVAGIVAALAAIASGVPYLTGVSIPASAYNGNNTTANHGLLGNAGSSAATSIVLVAGLAGLIGFIILIVSWLVWRGGVKQLAAGSGEYGDAYAAQAGAAVSEYGYTVILWIVGFLSSVVGGIVLVAVIVATAISGVGTRIGTTPTIDWSSIRNELIIGLVAISLIGTLFTFFTYFFATRSLRDSLYLLADPQQRAQLDQGRTWVLIGAAIAFASVLSFVVLPFSFVSVVGTIVLLLGFSKILGVYDQWLASPRRPGMTIAPAPAR